VNNLALFRVLLYAQVSNLIRLTSRKVLEFEHKRQFLDIKTGNFWKFLIECR